MAYMSSLNTGGGVLPITTTLYGTCDTAASTATKMITCSNFDQLADGFRIAILFTYGNTTGTVYININNTSAVQLDNPRVIDANELVDLIYINSKFHIFYQPVPKKLSQLTDDVVSGNYLPLSGGTMSGTASGIQFPTTTNPSLPNHYISAGGGYSVNSGKNGVKLIVCEQNDACTGIGQDCTGGPYELDIIAGNQPDSPSIGSIKFLKHSANSTNYSVLGTIDMSGYFTPGASGSVVNNDARAVTGHAVFQSLAQGNFLVFRGGVTGNMNDCKQTGFYYGNGMSNAPFDDGYGQFIVIAFADTVVTQIWLGYSVGYGGNLSIRKLYNGTWSAWSTK